MKRVSLFLDVEDPINDLADDAALDFARLFTDAGVRGSFCVTGDKCRVLRDRGRQDVAEALRPHCLGLHTNGHSRHPTTMELLADLPWEEGCAAAYAEERRGYDAFVNLFGRTPTFWGGAGNTWSPEITDALKKLGIGAYAYTLTSLPDDAVHRFNGVLGFAQTLAVSEDTWADDAMAAQATDRVLERVVQFPGPWVGVFVGHPTRFRYTQFWDAAYFGGQTPPEPVPTPPQPDEYYVRSQRNVSRFLSRLKDVAQVVGIDDAAALPWRFRAPTSEERTYFRSHTEAAIRGAARWPVHRPDLDPDLIVTKTLALAETVEVAEL